MSALEVVSENGKKYGRSKVGNKCTILAVTIQEDEEFEAFARQAEQNRKARLTAERKARHLQYLKQETKRFYRRRQVQKAVDRLVTIGLVASGMVCFHLLPWWSALAPAIGAAWLRWRAKCKG